MWSFLTNHRARFAIFGKKQESPFLPVCEDCLYRADVSCMPINIGTYHIQPTGVDGLCFGYCVSGPLPLRSLILGPLSRVHFGESLVVRLYSEIDHTYLSIEGQCVSHHYPRWTATPTPTLGHFNFVYWS